jgi:hypothetical protein
MAMLWQKLWQHRLWAEVTPHLPAGRVGVWAMSNLLPNPLVAPVATLLEEHNLQQLTHPSGAALQGVILLGAGAPAAGWPSVLATAHSLLAPGAPLLLLAPRQGLLQLPDTAWHSPLNQRAWRQVLRRARFTINHQHYVGGGNAVITAACHLWVCGKAANQVGGVPPTRLQFNSKLRGTAAVKGC